ncbi:MAG: hypothetical protein ACK5NT_04530 [Pyrinomonadaceae bacterium]
MGNTAFGTISGNAGVSGRILASLGATVSWNDRASRKEVSVSGVTESIGSSTVLVNLGMLPFVGAEVKISLFDNSRAIVNAGGEVIRIVRDPVNPKVAIQITKNTENWENVAVVAAQEWVAKKMALSYSEWEN